MTPKEYKNKMMVKVVGYSYCPNYKDLFVLGGTYEVRAYNFSDKTISVYPLNKTDISYTFNLSDVQIVTPVMYEGVNVCVGDKVKYSDMEEVLDYAFFDGEWILIVGTFEYTYNCSLNEIEALDPLYKEIDQNYTVEQEKWKPRFEERYWTPISGDISVMAIETKWLNDENDHHRLALNLVFKTKEEALARYDEILLAIKK